MEGLTLKQEEQARLAILNRVLEHQMTVREAACVLGLSERHAWRMLGTYRREGASALAHGNRGRRPANATPEEVRQQVIQLAHTSYAGFNHTHLTEMLTEREGVTLARSTVRQILVGAGLTSPRRRRPPRHRCRRERMSCEGMLVQMDGSYHDWLEGRGSWLTLLMAVDDATGTVPFAIFRDQEDTLGYLLLLEGIIRHRGIPMALYTDRHSVFQHPEPVSQKADLAGDRSNTQFGRALQELGITLLLARSPQAKGRVERAAGTFQDRLVAELRLTGASTMTEANSVLMDFLPRFNERFGVPPAQTGSSYRPVDPEMDMAGILCCRYGRKVARDNTVKNKWRTLQLLPDSDRPSYAGTCVEVQEHPDGTFVVSYQGRAITTREAPPRPGFLRSGNRTRERELSHIPHCFESILRQNEAGCQESNPSVGPSRSHLQRQPTPRQQACWNAVQTAKSRGLSLRRIARVLGISRTTVGKYVSAATPPVNHPRIATEYTLEIAPGIGIPQSPLTKSLITKT